MKTIKEIFNEIKKHTVFQNKKMLIVSIATFILIVIVIIFSQQEIIASEKMDFFVETKTIQEFNNEIEINKPGKIIWAEEIIISSQAMWTIKNINVKEWQSVWNWSTLVELNDNIANYWIMVQRAKNALNSARLQYSQSKTQLEQWISNSQLAIQQSQSSLVTAETLWEQNIRWAENSLSNANSQKNSLILQMKSEKQKLESLLSDVLHKNDTILWVTSQYKTKNDSYEIYLSAKNTSYKLKWRDQLLELYNKKEELEWLNTSNDISNSQLKNNIEKMDSIYEKIETFLKTMETILIKSVSSTTFTQTTIDWLIAANNLLQTTTQTNFTYFTTLKQSTDSALIETDNWEIIVWSESADIWYQSTMASTQQQISSAQIGLETAQLNYESALKTKNSTLWLAAANITSAELAYQEALKQYEKLKVKAPITWSVWKILVDKWQEISMWVPILTLINNSDPIVEIWLNSKELNKINSWSKVEIEYMWEMMSWEIISVWTQAWPNWLYNIIIKLAKKIEIIGDTASIKIYNENKNLALPINIVHPLEGNKWYIYVLENWEPEILNIDLGEIRWDKIEILTEIWENTQIITNHIWNYNPNIHELKINN